MTLSHEASDGDPVGAVLLDADLSILGAPPEVYDRYAAAVRREFDWVPEAMWLSGRATVLADLSQRSPLFLTAPARDRWELAAHANLARELASLRPG